MRSTIRLLAAVLSVALPGILLWSWLANQEARSSASELSLPREVGPWRMVFETDLDATTLSMISPDSYVMRRYEAPDRVPIYLYVGLYAGRRGYGRGAHDPQVCYPAHGWEVVDAGSVEIEMPESSTLVAKLLDAQRELLRQDVLYWFQPAGRWPMSEAVEQFLRIFDAAKGSPQYAFVRLSGPSGRQKESAAELREFAREIASKIRAQVEAI